MMSKLSLNYHEIVQAPNKTIAEFANTANPDKMAHNEPSHLDLQWLSSSL